MPRRRSSRRAGAPRRAAASAAASQDHAAPVRRSKAVDGRIRLLRLFCLVFLALAGGKALALASTRQLTAMALRQQMRTIDLPAHRGAILDRNGQDLAVGQPDADGVRDAVYAEDPRRPRMLWACLRSR